MGTPIEGAVLDVSLNGEMVWPVVDALMLRDVPITLATGYGGDAIPSAYAHLPRHEKPVTIGTLTRAVAARVAAAG